MSAQEHYQTLEMVPPPGQAGYDRTPPHNLDAEISVLGSMLLSRNAIAEVSELVGPEDFYRGAHRTIFEAARDLYDRGEPVDTVTLADELSRRGTLADVGGVVALNEIVRLVPTAANALYYARIVADQALRRRLIDAGTEITRTGYEPERDVDEVVDNAERLVFNVAQRRGTAEFTPMKELLNASFELLEKLHEQHSPITGLATGFTDFDELTAGLQPSNLVIVAARPAMGKSTLVTNLATHVAVELREPAVLFSLEMSQMELVQRVLAAEARVDSDRLRTGRLQESDWPRLSQAMGRLAEAPLFIDDTPGINLLEIRSKCRRLKQKHGLSLVIVDYLQLMQAHRRVDNRVQEVAEFSRGLKILAKELDLPVIALSQLSRKPEDRSDRRPQLSDLRESGCLPASARVVRADSGAEVTLGELFARGERDIPVWSVDHDYRIRTSTMTHVFSTGVKEVYRLDFASGRRLEATANHPLLTVDGWRRVDELAPGSRTAVPRRLPQPAATAVWPDEHVTLLAHLLGDGCFAARQPIHYTSGDLRNIEVVEAAARSFGITPRRVSRGTWWHTYLPSPHHLTHGVRNPIAAWLDALGGLYGRRSNEKFVPAAVFSLKDPQVAEFLAHLWATDGHLSRRHGCVRLRYASRSRRMVEDLQLLLLRFEVHSRIRTVATKGGSESYQLRIDGVDDQRRFLREVGVFGTRGELVPACLALLEAATGNADGDTVPAEIWSQVPSSTGGMPRPEPAAGPGGARPSFYRDAPSRQRLGRVAEVLADEHLRRVASSDLWWDEVVAITPVGRQEVFDATVRDTHNFLADNVVVENSIEQDADIVCFIYRDEVYDQESPAKGEAELIVAKHRNGPLKTVRLSFIGHHSRFANMARGPMGQAPPL